jgi:hypothetical protein
VKDADVRAAVRAKLQASHQNDPNTLVVEEMGVWANSVRIDIAVVNGELAGFELKSDRDTLERLPLQAKIYSKVFDRLTLVVGTRHAKKAVLMVPRWWGVIEAQETESGIALTNFREGKVNPKPDPLLVARLLWKPEAIEALAHHELAKGWRSKGLDQLHQRLAAELPFDVLAREVREALKSRQGWLGQHRPNQLNVPVHTDPHPKL